jgi:hypothetical protein
MAVGLGGFMQGFAQGFTTTTKTLSDLEKNKLEAEAARMKIDEAKTEKAYKEEIGQLYKNLAAGAEGGTIGGEAVDESGVSLGKMQFANKAEAEQSLSSQGLKFKEGTTIEKAGMSPLDLEKQFSDGLKVIASKYGKVDLDMLKKSREFDKDLQAEGAMEAMKYALSNPEDQEGIRKIFNEKGKFKLGDDVTVGVKQGLFGPTVYGYKIDAKGNQQQVFDGFNDIILPSMGAKAWSAVQADRAKVQVEQEGATFREGMKISSAEKIAANKEGKKSEGQKGLTDLMKTRYTSFWRNPLNAAESSRQQAIEGEIGALAERLVGTGVGPLNALNEAQTAVFKKYGVSTDELAPKKK